MSFVRVWLHIVFSTKNRVPALTKEKRPLVFQHLVQQGRQAGIFIDTAGGFSDHCHVLLSLGAGQKISEAVQSIKGESARWINANNIFEYKFAWQDDYFAVSISEGHVKKVREYIRNQEQHHTHVTFDEEFGEMSRKYQASVPSAEADCPKDSANK